MKVNNSVASVERHHDEGDGGEELDEDVDGGSGRVFAGVSNGVASDGGLVGLAALASMLPALYVLLSVVPGAPSLLKNIAIRIPVEVENIRNPAVTRAPS